MALLTFGGLASGLDTNSIIDALVQAERVPITQAKQRQTSINSALTTINAVSTKLGALKNAAQALSTSLGFSSYKSTSSDAAVVSTVSGVASPGSFDLTVNQLAKEQRTYSNAFGSSSADLGFSGSLSVQVGTGTAANITVDSTDSLTDIAAKINGSGIRANASVLFDGTNYKLQVRGLDTGSANGITFGESGVPLGLSTPANTVQSAQNARVTVDGNVIERPSNQFVGVIPGVSLALTKPTSTPVTVQVASDPEALSTKIKAFVTAYNDVVATSQNASGFGATKPGNTLLAGDATLRAVVDKLAGSVGNNVAGTTGIYKTLGSIGLSSDKEGRLKLDESKLASVMNSDPNSVMKLFVEDAQLGSTGAMKGVMTMVDQLAQNSNSLLKTKVESLGKQVKNIDDDVAGMERRIDLMTDQLRQRFTQLEMIMTKYQSQGSALAGLPSTSSSNG